MFNFYTTWKRHKISGFPMFSGGIEIELFAENALDIYASVSSIFPDFPFP